MKRRMNKLQTDHTVALPLKLMQWRVTSCDPDPREFCSAAFGCRSDGSPAFMQVDDWGMLNLTNLRNGKLSAEQCSQLAALLPYMVTLYLRQSSCEEADAEREAEEPEPEADDDDDDDYSGDDEEEDRRDDLPRRAESPPGQPPPSPPQSRSSSPAALNASSALSSDSGSSFPQLNVLRLT